MLEHHITIPRNLRYATLGQPSADIRQVWFVCHGYGQLAPRFTRYFEGLDDGSRLVVAPEGLHRYYVDHASRKVGATWMTSEDRLTDIEDYVRYLDLLHDRVFETLDRAAVEVVVLGFSQGVATVCRWAAFGTSQIDRLLLWSGLVPPDLDLDAHGDALRELNLTFVIGTEDQYANDGVIEGQRMMMEEKRIPFEMVTFEGGHTIDGDVLTQFG